MMEAEVVAYLNLFYTHLCLPGNKFWPHKTNKQNLKTYLFILLFIYYFI